MIRQRLDTGKWEVRWRENGRHRSRSFTRKADAERFATRVRSARELGDALDLDRGRETVAEFIERWWREYALLRLEDNTRKSYGQVWEKHLRSRIGGYRLRDVSPAVVHGVKSDLLSEKVGAPTIRKALAVLSAIFRCAVGVGTDRPEPGARCPHASSQAFEARATRCAGDRGGDASAASSRRG